MKKIKKVKTDLTQEENTYAMRFFNDLLKSIDINVEVIKQENIVLENSMNFNNIINYDKDKKTTTINNEKPEGERGSRSVSPAPLLTTHQKLDEMNTLAKGGIMSFKSKLYYF
jgi:hypothetical protein